MFSSFMCQISCWGGVGWGNLHWLQHASQHKMDDLNSRMLGLTVDFSPSLR